MKGKARKIVFVATAVVFLSVAGSGCSGDAPPSENQEQPNQQSEDAGGDVANDVDDTGEADPRETGEPCPDECVHPTGALYVCDSCEEERCYVPDLSPEDAYCTRVCEGDEECEDLDWECGYLDFCEKPD